MAWRFPLQRPVISTTADSDSFRKIDWTETVEVPVHPHCGSFGFMRRNHIHEGVDLYAKHGEPVVAVEAGRVVKVAPFTGPHAGSPWWLDTWCVMVEGPSGVLNYGEITPSPGVVEGAELQVGEVVGTVATVLAKDKGRPMSMLHLELYKPGTREFVEWKVEEAAPDGLSHRAAPPGGLLDPTPFLLGAMAAGAAPPPP